MSLWSGKPFVAIRVLGRNGHYPAFEIRSQDHVYVASEDIVWTAVLQQPLPEDWEYAERTILVPEEVRLLSAISLCEANPWDNGMPIITHWADAHVDAERIGDNLTDTSASRELEQIALSLGTGPTAQHGPFDQPGYNLSPVGSLADAEKLLREVDASDQLVLAGLTRFLESTRLLWLDEHEAAATSLFISTGAALEFIRLYLGETRESDSLPFAEVLSYLRERFPHGDEVAEYFEDTHALRNTALHPANRDGEFWTPPLMMDDIYRLHKSLITLYRHIILDEIPSE